MLFACTSSFGDNYCASDLRGNFCLMASKSRRRQASADRLW
jgi:hypothetical protein